MATGAGKLTVCQPNVVSPVNVAVASIWPAVFHRCAVCVPVLALPLKKRAPVMLPGTELRNLVPTSMASLSTSDAVPGAEPLVQMVHGQTFDEVVNVQVLVLASALPARSLT